MDNKEQVRNIIFAVGSNGAFGLNGGLPWASHNKEDMNNFKELTTASVNVVCGFNTWLSLGCKPLPKRNMLVVDRDANFFGEASKGVTKFPIECAEEIIDIVGESNYSVIGGKSLIEDFISLDISHTVYVTVFDGNFDADVFIDLTSLEENGYNVTSEQSIKDGTIYIYRKEV